MGSKTSNKKLEGKLTNDGKIDVGEPLLLGLRLYKTKEQRQHQNEKNPTKVRSTKMLSKTSDKKLEGKLTNDDKIDDGEPHCLGLRLRLPSGEDEMKWGNEMNSSKR